MPINAVLLSVGNVVKCSRRQDMTVFVWKVSSHFWDHCFNEFMFDCNWSASSLVVICRKCIVSTTPPDTIVSMHLSRWDNNGVMMDLPVIKPYCFDDKRFSSLMWVIIESLTNDFIDLHTIDVTYGFIVLCFFSSPFLKYWCNVCHFHPSSMVLFRRRATDLNTRSTNYMKSWWWISSGPHDLFTFNFDISFRTISSVIFI